MASIGEHFKINPSNFMVDGRTVFRGKNYRITVLSERLIRFEFSLNGVFYDGPTEIVHNRNFPMPQMKVEQNEKLLVIETKYFKLQYVKEKPFKGSSLVPDSNLKVKLLNTDKIWYYGHPEARNFKGSAFSIEEFGSETALSNGLYSTDGFATLDDSHTMFIDADGYMVPNEVKRTDFYLFVYRRDFGLCLRDYFTLSGYPPLIPRYALGIWWNRDQIYNFEDTKNLIQNFNKHEIPISILVLSEFWHKRDNNSKTGYDFETTLFPNPKEFTDYMHNLDVHIGLKLDGFDGVTNISKGYEQMCLDLNWNDVNPIPFKVLNKNFIASYFNNLINPLYALGVDFFWIDSKDEVLNRVLNYYHFTDFKKFSDRRGMLLSRNGGKAAHKYPVHYSGETRVGWDTLKYLPYFNSTSSNIGLSFWSHDIGGYKGGIEDSELYLRYIQFACFSPIFRLSAKRGAFYKREPWRWDIKTYTIVKDYCKLRQKLIPYIYTESYKYHKICLPLVEPLYYYYPELYDEPDYRNEYFFGSELLVAPITKGKDRIMNRAVEKVFLPKGIWYDFTTGKKFVGGKRYVTFYKDEDYPVFVKEGSIIPLCKLDENINYTGVPKRMEIDIFSGSSSSYNLYEDDGISNKYQEGYYIINKINFNYNKDNYILTIEPFEGRTSILPPQREYRLRFRNTKAPDRIIIDIDGEVVNDFEAFTEEKDFIVVVPNVDTKKKLTINCIGSNMEIAALRIINEDVNEIISDLKIETLLKERIAAIMLSDMPMNKKRIGIRKLKSTGLDPIFIKMFIKLLEYIEEI